MPGPVHHKNIPPIHHHTPTSQPDKLSRFLKALRKVSNDICTRLVNLFCCCFSKPPKNPQGQAKIDENDSAETLKIKEESARKIQEYFRRHVKRVREAKRNHYGIVSSEPYDGTKPEHKGRIYYFQINDQGILCAMYSPTKKPESPIAGTSKEVTGMDENFVELELKGNSFGREINNNDDLEDTFTVIPSIAVDSDTMIARFGGDNLVDYLQKKKFINPAHFENAVKDLDTLHKRSTYLTDIKVENFTYDGKNVNFIDVDNRVKIDPAKPKIIQPDMTPFCTTTKLLRVLRPDVFDDTFYSFFLTPEAAAAKKPYLKVCDEYAFLLAMIKATSKKNHLKKAVYGVHVGVVDINREFHGVMNDKNKSYFRKWIQKHVKPEFHSNVESILRDPHEYAEKTSNPPYLSDMLLFKGSYNV